MLREWREYTIRFGNSSIRRGKPAENGPYFAILPLRSASAGLRKTPASAHTVFLPLPARFKAEEAEISSSFSNPRRRAADPQADAFLFPKRKTTDRMHRIF
jgi:hypothetical protein